MIRVPERGHWDVSVAIWERLSDSPQMSELIERKIVSATHAGRNVVRLSGTSYVGRVVLQEAGVVLEMVEKVPGALSALLSYATHRSFRVERQPGVASDPGPLMGLLVAEFARDVQSYVNRGLDSEYAIESRTGSLVGGRVDLVKTIQLRARGMPHLMAYDKNVLTTNVLKNRVLLVALRQIEALSRVVPIGRDVIDWCRGLSLVFSECLVPEVLWAPRREFALSAEGLAADASTEDERDLIALAQVILSGVSFDRTQLLGETVPRAWFVNLETLFETAVRAALGECLEPRVNVVGVKRGSPLAAPLFPEASDRMPTNPDLVFIDNGETVAVGDVKYKVWPPEDDARGDFYQVLSHAAAFRSPRAFLVYPYDRFDPRSYGRSAFGCRTWAFPVRIERLKEDLESSVQLMGLEAPRESAVSRGEA